MVVATEAEQSLNASGFTGWFHQVLRREAEALAEVVQKLQHAEAIVSKACGLLASCRKNAGLGKRVIVGGVGKAGLIARKVTATLCSTGTPAVFVHPVEALHGDLGAVCRGDVGLLFSYSGLTPEVVRLAGELKRLDSKVLAVTRSSATDLGCIADVTIELGDIAEACELGLAPSSTTTAMLAIGDALALAVANADGFSAMDFAFNHPAGMLGLRFRRVSEFIRTGSRLVCVDLDATVQDVIRAVSSAKTGAAILVGADRRLQGIFTDGDLRRALVCGGMILQQPVRNYASVPCTFVGADASVADAWRQMLDRKIEDLPVVDADLRVVGLLCLKDLK